MGVFQQPGKGALSLYNAVQNQQDDSAADRQQETPDVKSCHCSQPQKGPDKPAYESTRDADQDSNDDSARVSARHDNFCEQPHD